MMTRRACIAAWAAQAGGATAWKPVHDASGHAIVDFVISRDGRPFAAAISDNKGVLLVRSGDKFVARPLPETPGSIFALSGDLCWMAGPGGVWRSTDSGRNWKRILEQSGVERVLFVDERRGWAAGAEKLVLHTIDGGATWAPVPAAGEPAAAAAHSTYHWIEFPTSRVGIIAGVSRPPRHGRTSSLPAWRDPDPETRRAEWPSASLILETRDGGATWKHSSTSLFGKMSRVRYSREGRGLALMEFHDAFEYPAEVFAIDLRGGRSERTFRRKDRAVTDILVLTGPEFWLACVEPPADPAQRSNGFVSFFRGQGGEWEEERPPNLLAGRVWIGGTAPGDLWAATDTGVILRR